jgi:hypothetical protein
MLEIHDNRKLDLIIRQEIPFAGNNLSILTRCESEICNLYGHKKSLLNERHTTTKLKFH